MGGAGVFGADATDHRATVLVADDLEGSRRVLAALVRAEGHEVIEAMDGREALERFRHGRIDLVLLDVLMPGLNGLEVCQAIKSDPTSRLVPVVLVTGLQSTDDRIAGIQAGADDFLTKPVAREELVARLRSLLRLKQFTDELENAETVLFSLALGIESKDPYTAGHCERLSRYSVALADAFQLPEEQRVALRRAGVVHDLGKLAVPERILLKPGPLTPDERRIMEQHPETGERICAPLKSFRHVLPIIRHHHEKLDGSGYPDGLRGDQIPLTARILATVDVFDALATDRPYRQAMSADEAFQVMRDGVAKGWWDPRLVDAFEAILGDLGYEPAPAAAR